MTTASLRIDRIQLIALFYRLNILGHVKTFFNWVIERGIYGIETSPCDRIKPSRLIGPKHPRQRVLSDIEIAAFWRASGRLGYPIGSLFRMLLLTGQRKSEVAEARWREFDLHNRLWVVPPERFKSDAAHNVPLSDDVLALLETLPRWKSGDFLFEHWWKDAGQRFQQSQAAPRSPHAAQSPIGYLINSSNGTLCHS